MNPEGEITVRLTCGDQRVRKVSVASSRTGLPPRLVRGRPAADVQRLVPLLFSVCQRAQGAASTAAIAAAQGLEAGARDRQRQALDVTVETLQEGVWRLLIDWPRALGEPAEVPAVASVRRAGSAVVDDGATLDALLTVADDVLQQHVHGTPAEAWLASTDLAALDRWVEAGATLAARLLRRMRDEAPGLGRSDVPLMPDATLENLRRSVLDDMEADSGYDRYPRWGGAPAETGALARQADAPLVAALLGRDGRSASTRFAARLVELAVLVRDLRARSAGRVAAVRRHALPNGVGVGLAETARGLLLHRVQVNGGLVTDYRIVAPTEWNFHPQGPLPQGLAGLDAADRGRLDRDARVVVQSLDPCVACRVEIGDA
ncbi:MAG: nickel-dependent hydrogenase large subunit [Betaproteobacteria bacterium]